MDEFRQLVIKIVTLLEHERHIDRLDTKETEKAKDLFADLTAEPLVVKLEELRHSGGDVHAAIMVAKEFGDELDRTRNVIEKRFGYYNRLAVIGTISQLVIHEIRNRTTVIGRGLRKAKELAEKLKNVVTCQAVDLAQQSVKSLETLADRFAPLASRGYRAGRRSSILEESVSRCCVMYEAEIRACRAEVELPPTSNTMVRIDPGEIDAVILNLLNNSLYWLQRNDGERRILFRLTPGPRPGRVTVAIDDTGPGINPEDADRVFWPGVTRKTDGIGMGLTVASELIDGHGGKMRTVVPGELGGATFEFDLPLLDEGKQ